MAELDGYYSGARLYGDDFAPPDLERWFRDEAEAYYALGEPPAPGRYGYHALNWHHAFRHLPDRRWAHVLGLGSAFGDELAPVLDRADAVTILEPARGFRNARFAYVAPSPSGAMPFDAGAFDLIVVLGVLHHIPNVTFVVSELARCLAPGGHLLVREPVISMGDWTRPRRGLTKRERGIPTALLRRMIAAAGLRVVREARCMFALSSRLRYLSSSLPYNRRWSTALDAAVCALPWPDRYHATRWWQKLRATCVFYVLTKP